MIRRLAAICTIAGVLAVAAPTAALAHPLGNYSVNHHLGIALTRYEARVTYVLDMAEVPAFQTLRSADTDASGEIERSESAGYSESACSEATGALGLELDGVRRRLTLASSTMALADGQGGLRTLRLECEYTVELGMEVGDTFTVSAWDRSYAERIGWREVVVTGDGVSVDTSGFAVSPSAILTNYPRGPVQDLSTASGRGLVTGEPSGTVMAASQASAGVGGPVGVLGSILAAPGIGPGALLVAMGVAFALGLVHALAPGHGKSIMAAYLVGSNGTKANAATLGLTVAVSHTLGVGILGVVAFAATSAFRPELVYPFLSLVSAVVILAVGVYLTIRALRAPSRSRDREHHHHHGHDHHAEHAHPHSVEQARTAGGGVTVTWRAMLALGLSGGLVPSASAVVLLLGAINLGRAGIGVLLVFLFGLGMSTALVGVGLAVVGARDLGMRRLDGRWAGTLRRVGPTVAAALVLVAGVVLTFGAAHGLIS